MEDKASTQELVGGALALLFLYSFISGWFDTSNDIQYDKIIDGKFESYIVDLHYIDGDYGEDFIVETEYGNAYIQEDFFEMLKDVKGYKCTFHFENLNESKIKKSPEFVEETYNWSLVEISDCK